MGNFFNMDNGFFTALGKFVDLIIISLVWLILCIPVVTIGPATTSLYYAVVKVIRRERGYLVREFFHSFKTNFKTGLIAGIILTVLFAVLVFDRKFATTMTGNQGFILLSIFNAMIFLLICVTLYLFPLLSRFTMGIKQLFKTAVFMAMKHLPTTILLIIIFAAISLGTYIMPIAILISPALCILLESFLLERVFKKYMPEKSEEAESSGRDEWYLE
ncbi:YesL family protein [Anaerocolumna sp. MB42-C2]|uniref:YesL family protein n=1 Tax=Anaerocolumna sp. MB42-C2 TaxID=3070997 RepID=UPI0027E0033D|nr:YesL family protein [Anaerocolumna sp. MB42-C2]WMJ88696.1 YesL family protein [Anaerocolumna sp. MB42-C2]